MLSFLTRIINKLTTVFTCQHKHTQQIKVDTPLAGIGPLMSAVCRSKQQYSSQLLLTCAEKLQTISDKKFRYMVQCMLVAQGYEVRSVKNNQTDLLAIINNCGILVRTINNAETLADRNTYSVGLDECEQLHNDCLLVEAEAGMLISSGTIHSDSYQYCREHGLYGLSDYSLLSMFEQNQVIDLESFANRYQFDYVSALAPSC